MQNIVITITPSLTLLILVIVALMVGWFGGYLNGRGEAELKRRAEVKITGDQHAAAIKNINATARETFETFDKLA